MEEKKNTEISDNCLASVTGSDGMSPFPFQPEPTRHSTGYIHKGDWVLTKTNEFSLFETGHCRVTGEPTIVDAEVTKYTYNTRENTVRYEWTRTMPLFALTVTSPPAWARLVN